MGALRGPSRRYLVAKRALDLVVCSVLLLLALPVMAACAMAIRLDTAGPVVFAQMRTGRDARRFRMWKFRTMVANAEDLKAGLAHLNVLPPPDFKIPDDPRITRVGRFLRATSLDELPQLVNVLRGEMSLVGPRPWPPELVERQLARGVDYRLRVVAGWTGPAQVSKGLDMRYENLDRGYVELLETRSARDVVRYDLRILRRTLATMLRHEGLSY